MSQYIEFLQTKKGNLELMRYNSHENKFWQYGTKKA